MELAHQVVLIFAASKGFVDEVPVEQIRTWEAGLYEYLDLEETKLLEAIREKKALDDEIVSGIEKALKEWNKRFVAA